LLYHHIVEYQGSEAEYTVDLKDFTAQMQLLKDWGYKTVTVSELAEVIRNGGYLPPRPVVITFDDGSISVFQNAYPIMQQLGFRGTLYIISYKIGGDTTMTTDMLKQMHASGWEIGSHSQTHADLSKARRRAVEICASKKDLTKALQLEINSFAYPYGIAGGQVRIQVRLCDYLSGVGLGTIYEHNSWSLYYMIRLEVAGDISLDDFAEMLPWSEENSE